MRRRGALLLEVMVSIVLFVSAASFCLAATRSLHAALDRAERRRFAVDLARSKLAELEAGLVAVGSLRGEWSGAVGSHEPADRVLGEDQGAGARWQLAVSTSRSPYRGLSLVELTVSEAPPPGRGGRDDRETVSFTLRSLVALREAEAEAYEADAMLEGLEEAGP